MSGGARVTRNSADISAFRTKRRLKKWASARALTGERSNRAVLDLALRRLIASKQKGAMIDGIAALSDLEAELGAPLCPPT